MISVPAGRAISKSSGRNFLAFASIIIEVRSSSMMIRSPFLGLKYRGGVIGSQRLILCGAGKGVFRWAWVIRNEAGAPGLALVALVLTLFLERAEDLRFGVG